MTNVLMSNDQRPSDQQANDRHPNPEEREIGPLARWSLAVVLIGAFLIRLVPLGRYVTPDEPAWVYRSIRFYDALAACDWAAVPSTGHPGVTTMWLGAAGVAVRRLLDPAGSLFHLDWIRRLAWLAPENGEAFRHLAVFLPCGRVAVALVTTLGLLVAYALAARAFDRRVALVMMGLLAFEPLLVGHSGLLHTDALLATFTLLALLAAFNGLEDARPAPWWALSGLFAGLALLTKTPALLLVLFLPLLALAQRPFSFSRLSAFLFPFAAAVGVTAWALFPALWADPLGAVRTMMGFAGRHMEMAQRPIFFAGHVTYDPGPAFYAVVLLFRISPLVLVGVILGLVRLRRLSSDRRFALLASLAFALLFGAMMSLGAKKHDRYLLPAFPPLTLAAALSLIQGPKFETRRLRIPILLALQLLLLLPFALHPLTYANPLLGGPSLAAQVLSLDWGEGMGAAARWLNHLPGADRLTAAAANVPSFAPLFAGRTVPLNDATAPLADYLVTGIGHQVSSARHPAYTATLGFLPHAVVLTNTAPLEQAAFLVDHVAPDDLILLDADTPLLRRYAGPGTVLSAAALPDEAALTEWLEAHVRGHESIWLVASPAASPITAAHLRHALEAIAVPERTIAIASATFTRYLPRSLCPSVPPPPRYRAVFGGALSLVDAVLPSAVAWPDSLAVTLRWRALAPPPTDYRATVVLRDEEGHDWSRADPLVLNGTFFPTSFWSAGEWTDAMVELSLPPGIPPGHYSLEVSLFDVVTGAGLGAVGPDGRFLGTQVVIGEVTVSSPATPPDPAALQVPRRLGLPAGPLTLLGITPPPAQVLSGDLFAFSIFWQADDAPEADYWVRLRLVGEGRVALEEVVPLSPYPTSRWRAEDRFESRYSLHVPPDLPPGRYWLALNVLDPEEGALWAADRSVAEVEVLPRERSFGMPEDIPHRLDLTFGEGIHLQGYGLDRMRAAPGGSLTLTLYWRAEGPTDRSYTLFVHLLGPDGLSHGQVDRIPGRGQAPTSSWAAGQVIVDEIALPVDVDAPPGVYHIAVGFYEVAYGTRLPVTDASGQPLPDDRAILPVEVIIAGGSQ